MKKSKLLIPVLSLALLAACDNSGKNTESNQPQADSQRPQPDVRQSQVDSSRLNTHGFAASQLEFFQEAFNSADPNDGEIVKYGFAQPCIQKYRAEMLQQGFDDTDVAPGIRVTVTKRIMTQSVNFRGWKFGDWIYKVLSTAGSREDVDFRVEFGIYDAAFIREYVPDDASQQRPRLNRITAFVVPYKTGTSTILADLPPDEEVYNLGGLKP
ncbi:hypothetical protein AAHN97_12395 [Chitinophaga niabensis]|uniref:hypothetical protein n=1 Tax=Chitinophaga niabensis TaxID=536979 RepID=UPI0031B9E98A